MQLKDSQGIRWNGSHAGVIITFLLLTYLPKSSLSPQCFEACNFLILFWVFELFLPCRDDNPLCSFCKSSVYCFLVYLLSAYIL